MLQPVVGVAGSGQSDGDEFADIEWELCCSSREASLGFVPSLSGLYESVDQGRAGQVELARRPWERRR
jgi:hypothetical protein